MKKEHLKRKNVREKLQEKLKRQKAREKGITLIALVVTIIILLILAGVTLSLSLSQNGLFSRAQNAADRYKKAQTDEEEMIKNMATEIEKIENGNNSGNDDKEESKIQVKLEVEEANVKGDSIPVKATVTGEDGEEVQEGITYKWYKQEEGSSEETVETAEESNGSHTFSGLDQAKDYTIRVVAKSADGETGEVSVTVKALIIKHLKNTSDIEGALEYFRYREGMTWSDWVNSGYKHTLSDNRQLTVVSGTATWEGQYYGDQKERISCIGDKDSSWTSHNMYGRIAIGPNLKRPAYVLFFERSDIKSYNPTTLSLKNAYLVVDPDVSIPYFRLKYPFGHTLYASFDGSAPQGLVPERRLCVRRY